MKNLFEFVVLLHPKKSEDRSQIVVAPKFCLASSSAIASMVAARSIPDEYDDRLDEIEIIVRTFGQQTIQVSSGTSWVDYSGNNALSGTLVSSRGNFTTLTAPSITSDLDFTNRISNEKEVISYNAKNLL